MIKKTSIISIAIAALIATTGAQTVFHPPGKETARPTESIPLDFDKRAANSKGSKTSLKSPQKTCTLTVGFKYDPDQLKPSTIRVFNSDYHPNRMYLVENNTVSAEVPAGIYDVMCSFDNKKKYDPENPGPHQITVILENIDITKDTIVYADASTATNRIRFSSVNPDGKQSVLPDYDSETQKIDDSKSTCQEINYSNYIIRKGFTGLGTYDISSGVFYDVNTDGIPTDRLFDIVVNDVSDSWRFVQTRIIDIGKKRTDPTNLAMIRLEGFPGRTPEVTNDPADFTSALVTEFALTPAAFMNLKRENLIAVNMDNYVSGASSDGIWKSKTYYGNIHFNAPFSHQAGNADCNMMASVESLERDGLFTILGEEMSISEGIRTLPLRQTGNKTEYVELPLLGHHQTYLQGQGEGIHLDENPFIRTCFSKFHDMWGASAAYCTLFSQVVDYGDGVIIRGLLPDYYCNNGGERKIDLGVGTKFYVTYNGEKVHESNDLYTYFNWEFEWAEAAKPSGKMLHTYTNSNIKVDGIDGSNITEVYYDENNEDTSVPTIQFVRFSDKEGMPKIKLKSSDNPKVEIYAGDWAYNNETNTMDFSEIESIVAEYARNGSQEFTKLNLDYKPENYFRGYGQYFTANLEEITSDGWYDFRIIVTDKTGNYQKQTISPAFRIESGNDGIENIMESVTYADVYTLSGIQIGHRLDTTGIRSLPKGIYILRLNNGQILKTAL